MSVLWSRQHTGLQTHTDLFTHHHALTRHGRATQTLKLAEIVSFWCVRPPFQLNLTQSTIYTSCLQRSPVCEPPQPNLFSQHLSLPTWSCVPLSTLQCLIISKTCKCIHIHGGTDAKLTVAETHLTVPASQSASSSNGGRDWGGAEDKGERKQEARRREHEEGGESREGWLLKQSCSASGERVLGVCLPNLRWVTNQKVALKLPRTASWHRSERTSFSRAKAGQMEGGAAVQSEQMAAPNLIYEINNVSQIECRHRNTLPEF